MLCRRDNDYRYKRSTVLYLAGVKSWNNHRILAARFRFHRAISKSLDRAVDAGTFVRHAAEQMPAIPAPQNAAERRADTAKFDMFELSNHYLEKAARGDLVQPTVFHLMSANYRDMAALSGDAAQRERLQAQQAGYETHARRVETSQSDGTAVAPAAGPPAVAPAARPPAVAPAAGPPAVAKKG